MLPPAVIRQESAGANPLRLGVRVEWFVRAYPKIFAFIRSTTEAVRASDRWEYRFTICKVLCPKGLGDFSQAGAIHGEVGRGAMPQL
jgi:hypothetical protein